MEGDSLHSLSMRSSRKADRSSQMHTQTRDTEDGGLFSPGKVSRDPMKMIWKRGCVRLFLVSAIAWMMLILFALLFHVWSCHTEIRFLSALCRKDSKVLVILDTIGLAPKPQHRCSIPLADDPDAIVIPNRTPDIIPKVLSYIKVDNQHPSLFGGHQSWSERETSFQLNESMKVF